MEFTNDLKKKLGNAQNKEEAQAIIDETKKGAEQAGILLDDEDLDKAAGGLPGLFPK
jgi:hypothetical protein